MFILEGTIGAGKSTFLSLLCKQLPDLAVAFEPVDIWQTECNGESLLNSFYADPQRWSCTMEVLSMICRIQAHLKDQAEPNRRLIVERSIYSGHYCFAQNGYDRGFFTDLEWNIYTSWFETCVPHCIPPRGFIYLRVDPAIAYQRIQKRQRTGEATIDLAYLEQLGAYHDRYLIEKSNVLEKLKSVPLLVLDANSDFEEDPQTMSHLAERVALFVNTYE